MMASRWSFFNPNRCSTQVWNILCYHGLLKIKLSVCMCGRGALAGISPLRVTESFPVSISPSQPPACFPLPFARLDRPTATTVLPSLAVCFW